MIRVYILWVREKYVPAKHARYGDPWDENWKIACISENEQGVYETADDIRPEWDTKVTSYKMDTILIDGILPEGHYYG